MINVSKFVKTHTPLCVCTLGGAVLGYLGYQAVKWIVHKCQRTEKIDGIARARKNTKNLTQITQTPPLSEKGAILYLSISGNPVHLGHMAVVGAAIDHLRAKNIPVKEVKISLSHESYLASKVADNNTSVLKSNDKDLAKKNYKVLIPRNTRVKFLEATIQEANRRNMFQNIPVSYWNDQDKGESDHPASYRRLASQNPSNRVYLLAGVDLANNMAWSVDSVAHAIIVPRDGYELKEVKQVENGTRWVASNANYSEFGHYSSSKIQAGEKLMATEALNEEFALLRETALSL